MMPTTLDTQVENAELKLPALINEHNLPMAIMVHLSHLLQAISLVPVVLHTHNCFVLQYNVEFHQIYQVNHFRSKCKQNLTRFFLLFFFSEMHVSPSSIPLASPHMSTSSQTIKCGSSNTPRKQKLRGNIKLRQWNQVFQI